MLNVYSPRRPIYNCGRGIFVSVLIKTELFKIDQSELNI